MNRLVLMSLDKKGFKGSKNQSVLFYLRYVIMLQGLLIMLLHFILVWEYFLQNYIFCTFPSKDATKYSSSTIPFSTFATFLQNTFFKALILSFKDNSFFFFANTVSFFNFYSA